MGLSMGSKSGCGYSTRARPCFRSIKSSTMPDCNGPGRNNATSATISSKQSGLSRLIKSFMPRDSNWKTAVVLQAFNKSKACLSSLAIRLISMTSPVIKATFLIAQSMMVNVLNPRKSNLTSPTDSTSSLSSCVTRLPPPASQ